MASAPRIFENIRRLGYLAGRMHRHLGGNAPGPAAWASTYNGDRYREGFLEGFAAELIASGAERSAVQRERRAVAALIPQRSA